MKLYLVRHGQSIANTVTGRSTGFPDSDLTKLGCLQVETTAAFLRDHDFMPGLYDQKPLKFSPCALYSSPTRRGLKTAKVIADELGLSVGIDVRLHEVGGAQGCIGVWGGLPKNDAQKMAGSSYFVQEYPVMGWWFRQDESQKEAICRIHEWLMWLQERHHEDDVVVVVGHGALFDVIAAVAFGYSNHVVWLSMHNAAVARIDYDCKKPEWKLIFWNQTTHLGGLITY